MNINSIPPANPKRSMHKRSYEKLQILDYNSYIKMWDTASETIISAFYDSEMLSEGSQLAQRVPPAL